MHPGLARLISDYQAAVARAVSLLEKAGIPRPRSCTDWVANDIEQDGVLAGGARYYKHGFGCAVHLAEGVVDFDFGEHGEIDGFSASRLEGFAASRLTEYGFGSIAELETSFKAAHSAGDLVFSGYILYYLAAPLP